MAEEIHGFSHAELVEAMIKAKDIHEGYWMLAVTYGFAASNVGENAESLNPAFVVPILGVGIRRVTAKENNLTVDASSVNPAKG